jgi:hypothetical protein
MSIARKNIVAALIVAAACACLPAGSASAGPVVLAGSDNWNSWTTSELLSGQFWANYSHDRNHLANIGYFLSGTPGSDVPTFYDNSPRTGLPFLGDGSTTFALRLTDPWQPTDFTHLLSITGWDDEFGLFNIDTGEKYALFHAWSTKGQTTAFYPTGTYGFYVANGDGQTWYSTTLDGGRNHFAVFQGENRWYLGLEDATYTTRLAADWDYNDMIVTWAAQPVPEAGAMSMLALGLMSIEMARRRWRR